MLGYIVIDCSFTTSAFIVNIYNKFFLGTLPTLGNQLFESVSLIWRTLKMALPLAGRAKRRNGGSKLLAFLSKNALKEGPLFYNSFLLFSKGRLWKISKYLAVYTTHLVEKNDRSVLMTGLMFEEMFWQIAACSMWWIVDIINTYYESNYQ